ncbi:hypothetical protein ASAP_1910 [Asaia bogorensis]|uniref:Uncharacterized protein n=1 Tax=Asaia bogorensis TaxID=91915 RepID=A0A060QG71_9PROT|nr:hypothetical protein ASAP_1910 [Asaia bogorensis]
MNPFVRYDTVCCNGRLAAMGVSLSYTQPERYAAAYFFET